MQKNTNDISRKKRRSSFPQQEKNLREKKEKKRKSGPGLKSIPRGGEPSYPVLRKGGTCQIEARLRACPDDPSSSRGGKEER